MALSTSYYSTIPIDERSYDPWQPSARRIQVLPVHCSLGSPSSGRPARPFQGFENSHRSLLDPIFNGQFLCYRSDDGWHSPPTILVCNQSVDAHQQLESCLPNLSSEYTFHVQESQLSTTYSTSTYDLEKRSVDAVPQYRHSEHTEHVTGWNEPYCDTEGCCKQKAGSHYLMYTHSAQPVRDHQQSSSNSLYETHECSGNHALSQPNHPHVSSRWSGMGIDISTGGGHGQHVGAPISFSTIADQDRMVQNQGQDRCVGMAQLPTLHSECPPISTYSELSAQMLYYVGLSSTQQSRTSGSSSPSITTLVTTEASNPLNPTPGPSDWQASKSGVGTSMTLFTLPLLPKPSRTPSAHSSYTQSHKSRMLSPSSQGRRGLKTIMRGGSDQKKQKLACLFCRERKIMCERPQDGSNDLSCNQCLRRSLKCKYPTESRRGQHKKKKKKGTDVPGKMTSSVRPCAIQDSSCSTSSCTF
ncbi:hypothetical protein F5887DRAFT_995567 [Amanita rubescens]|nr:hypothetical protein F5887DRAFT_995567 [Amanita rubescens]